MREWVPNCARRDLTTCQRVDEESLAVPASLLHFLCKAMKLYESCLHMPDEKTRAELSQEVRPTMRSL